MFPDEIEGIRQFLSEHGTAPAAIVLTHSHWDHILGPEHFPGVRIIAQEEAKVKVEDFSASASTFRHWDKTLEEIERWEDENEVTRDRPFVAPAPSETFAERMSLRIGNLDLQMLHAPGHWPDELVVYEPESGLLWAGDMLSDIEIPFVSHSLAAYEKTLASLSKLDVRVLVPGHGAPTTDAGEINRRITEDRCYLAELRQSVAGWLRQGRRPENLKSTIVEGFTLTPKLEGNRYPHQLNIQTVWIELGGEGETSELGWGSQ
jgi:glyoxylase-like metal-dependent hydrolase (beta-lactamase superfamily II)